MRRVRRLKLECLETRTLLATIQGDVFEDANGNQVYDQFLGDSVIPGRTLFIDSNQNGELDGESVEPDDFPFSANLDSINPHVTLVSVDDSNQPRGGDVRARADSDRSTGNLVIGGSWSDDRRLRLNFTSEVSWLAIDAIGNRITGLLEVYNSSDQLLTSFETPGLDGNGYERMFISRPTDDIAYAVAYTTGNFMQLDYLRFGSSSLGEPIAKSNFTGRYSFSNLPAGAFDVTAVQQNDWLQTSPTAPESHSVVLASDDTVLGLDFGFATLETPMAISGVVYHDYNNEGTSKERFEQGVPDRRVYVDLDGNGSFSDGEPTAFTDEWGAYELRVYNAGLFDVRTEIPVGWTQTFPENDSPRSVLVNGVDSIVDMDLGVRRDNVPFTAGSILVSRSSWVTTDLLLELNRDGEIIQGVRVPGTEDFSRNRIQDLAVDVQGRVHMIMHTDGGNSLITYDDQTETFSTLDIPGWSTQFIQENDDQIAIFGDYLFVADHSNDVNNSGVIRINVNDMSWERFTSGIDNPYEIAIGYDGLLYTMEEGESNAVVNVFNPNSMAFFRQILLPSGRGFLEVDEIGHSYTPSHRDANGVKLDDSPLGTLFGSLDLGANGDLLFSGGVFGGMGLINNSFHPNTEVFFRTFIDSSNGGETYAVFNEPPVSGPITVESVAINTGIESPPDLPGKGERPFSWEQQKSDIRTIEVTFTEPPVVSASDMFLVNTGVDAVSEPDFAVHIDESQVNVVGNVLTLTFSHRELPEGIYDLILRESITDLSGRQLDGNGDGSRGDPFVYRGSEENGFYKFVADWNGDTGTSVFDYPAFSYWFGTATGTGPGNSPAYMDLDGDLGFAIFDFNGFSDNFGLGVAFRDALARSVVLVSDESNAVEDESLDGSEILIRPSTSPDWGDFRLVPEDDVWVNEFATTNDVALEEFLTELADGLAF